MMITKLHAEILDKSFLPYSTCDDYRQEGETLRITIADTGNQTYNQLLIVHALIERLLASEKGITDEKITAFDLAHPDADEPGEEPDAPYRDAHLIAKAVEMILCAHLGIPWKVYEACLEKVCA